MENILVKKIHPDAVIPSRKSEEAAGYDLHTVVNFEIWPGQQLVIPTGLVIQPPPGYHTEILIRSSMAFKYSIYLANSVGLIDRDFASEKDEVKLILYRALAGDFYRGANTGKMYPEKLNLSELQYRVGPVEFKKGDRIAQLLIRKTEAFEFLEVNEAPSSIVRGGFGSTGK